MGMVETIRLPTPAAAAPDVERTAVEPTGPVGARSYWASEVDPRLWPEWQALVGEASEPNSFAEPWFVRISLETLGGSRRIRLIEARLDGRLIGVLPIVTEIPYGRLPVLYSQNWCHDHMFLGTPLVQPGRETDFWTAVLTHLDEAQWAWSFLHVHNLVENGPVHEGLKAAAVRLGRQCSVVHRRVRAALESDLGPQAYFEQSVRSKKRKELRRLRNRLSELGELRFRYLEDRSRIDRWCDDFLALERKGWKGQAGSALADRAETESYFRRVCHCAWDHGRLQFLRLDLDDRPLAMLANLVSPPGSFSFKTCFDEEFARFSPGVLLQIENLAILDREDVQWMDSCAMDDHPMIDHLWTERRTVVRVTVGLAGARRRLVHRLCRFLENLMAQARSKWS